MVQRSNVAGRYHHSVRVVGGDIVSVRALTPMVISGQLAWIGTPPASICRLPRARISRLRPRRGRSIVA